MSYALATLWHERQRFLPGVLAVGFSALLITLQCGLLFGLFSITSMPIDRTRAHIWMGAPQVRSVDLGRPIPERYLTYLASQPEVDRCEPYLQGFAYWARPDGGTELCMVIGSQLEPDALGAIDKLTPEFRELLTSEGSIIVDESDKERLGIENVGDTAEISGVQVRVVAMTTGLKSLAGPYVFSSITTARRLLRLQPDQITYVLATCRDPNDAPKVVERMHQEYSQLTAFTSPDFSVHSQKHWVLKTKAGFALGYAAALGLLVGAVVTSQTLYAATAASLKEFAVLRALGIPRWRMAMLVVTQAFWIGVFGLLLAYPAVEGIARLADAQGLQIKREWWLLASAAAVTLGMAILSGLLALRSLRKAEPAELLR
jgi:putative ABC transport system permease protein